MEEWKPIAKWQGRYFVSADGMIRSPRGRECRLPSDKDGYKTLSRTFAGQVFNLKAHRAVYEAFVGPIPEGLVINHKNGVKHDNRVENLEAVSTAENIQHSFRVLGRKGKNHNPSKGEKNGNSRFKEADILAIRASTDSGSKLARHYLTSEMVISRIRTKRCWKHLP